MTAVERYEQPMTGDQIAGRVCVFCESPDGDLVPLIPGPPVRFVRGVEARLTVCGPCSARLPVDIWKHPVIQTERESMAMNANVERAGTVRFVVEVNDALYDWLVQIPGWVSMTGGPPPNRRVTVEDLIDDGVLGEASSNLDHRSTKLSLEERKAIQAAWHVETRRLA